MIKQLFFFAVISFTLIPAISFCQNSRVIHLSDSLLTSEKIFTADVYAQLKEKSRTAANKFNSSSDSILRHAGNSLNPTKKDSLGFLKSSLQKNVIANSESFPASLTKIPDTYSKKVNTVRSINNVSDASNSLSSIDEEFRDALTSAADDYYDKLNDYVDNAIDSLSNYADALNDSQENENDNLDFAWDTYYTYGLFAKIGYTTDMQYRGYQGAGPQSAFFPGLSYSHPIGLGAFINAYNIKGTTTPWDEIEIGLLYNHSFTDNLSFSLSYTHYTFNDTSEISKQGITGIAGVGLGYEFPFVSTGLSFDASFNDEVDYSLSLDFSKRIDLAKKPSFRLWFEPDISGIFGTEVLLNDKINQKINGGGNGNGHGQGGGGTIVTDVITTTNHVFAILAYQFIFPLNLQVGRFIVTPAYNYVIPLNQPTSTNSVAFGFFTMNVSLKIF
jgi:hypothetical protein